MNLSLHKTRGLPSGAVGIGLNGIGLKGTGSSIGRWLVNSVDALLDWQERARQRHHLSELDDHMLHDIGLSRTDVELEITKPIWRG